jgi:hypothetical protein
MSVSFDLVRVEDLVNLVCSALDFLKLRNFDFSAATREKYGDGFVLHTMADYLTENWDHSGSAVVCDLLRRGYFGESFDIWLAIWIGRHARSYLSHGAAPNSPEMSVSIGCEARILSRLHYTRHMGYPYTHIAYVDLRSIAHAGTSRSIHDDYYFDTPSSSLS